MNNSCLPNYLYDPVFVPSSTDCVAPSFSEHRSRLTIAGLFFRSHEQGPHTNLLEVEYIGTTFNIYRNTMLVEGYTPINTGPGTISLLRGVLSASSFIEMPLFHADVNDSRTEEYDGVINILHPTSGLQHFTRNFLTGGSGPPTDPVQLSNIRTGPTRTLCVIQTSENATGQSVQLYSNRTRQWNGYQWVSYSNNTVGQCPL